MLVLDTNAVIGYLAGDQKLTHTVDAMGARGISIAIPTVVITELLSYPSLTEDHRIGIEEFINAAHLLSLDVAVARYAATLRREYGLTTIDAIVAATVAVRTDAHLVTRDRAFKKIPGIGLLDV